MGKRGEITVFLSMVFICVAGLICVMLESARTAGARCYLQTAANSSMDSLLSQYHRELWQQYHLFGLEYQSELELENRYLGFLDGYLSVKNWYPMEAEFAQTERLLGLTDEEGVWLEQEVLDYMKYGVWDNLDITPESGERFWKDIREAGAMQELTASYRTESKEAWKLEQALNRIYGNLNRQKELYREAADALGGENGSGFFRVARQLEEEIKNLPKLVAAYEKQADKLKKKLEEMEGELEGKKDDLTEGMGQTMEQELEKYRAYVEADGPRRQEIVNLVSMGEQNLALIQDVKEQVHEIEDYISSLEEEEDDDSGPMWEAAGDAWQQFHQSGMTDQGVKDEEKRGWLEQIEHMVNLDLLELVVPADKEISEVILDLTDAPSGTQERTGETDKMNLVKRVLVNEYCAMHFSAFVEEKDDKTESGQNTNNQNASEQESGNQEEQADNRPVQQYQMEYLLIGEGGDRDNLAGAVKRILAVREGLNLVHILSDSQKREEAKALAMVITGALGITPLVEITAFFVMSVWALGESIADVRALLAGRRVPLLKRKEEWTLGLEQLLAMGQEQMAPVSENRENGFTYEGYLKLLLLTEVSEQKYYRMMDVMQMQLRLLQPGFLMEYCGYRVDMSTQICGKHVFFALPFVEKLTKSKEHVYQMQVRAQKAY